MKLIDMDLRTLIDQTKLPKANPGGGAILIIISNLSINLIFMMDKKDYGDRNSEAEVSRETLNEISKRYDSLMQEDVDSFRELMDCFKEDLSEIQMKDKYIKASRPLITMIEGNLKALDAFGFFLEYGKLSTLTDGQMANNLLREAIYSSFSTIEINLNSIDQKFDFDEVRKKVNALHYRNNKIIERRKK